MIEDNNTKKQELMSVNTIRLQFYMLVINTLPPPPPLRTISAISVQAIN